MPTILGTSGDDILLGTGGDDTIIGRGGFDTIDGGDGNDILKGGGDDDTIYGGIGNDAITGGAGNDSIDTGSGDNVVEGGSGNDQIYATEGNDTITGGQGYDYIDAGAGNNVINGGDGNDTVNVSSNGANTIHGGAGNDQVTTGNGNDVIYGGQGNDIINAGDGDNTISGGAGDDTINTTPGWFTPSNNNVADGGDGNDTIFTGFGNDIINGGDGDDNIFGYMGNDTIHGGQGNDTISVQSGMSLMYGDQGDDQITGGYEQDTIRGGQGNDTINGLEGADDIEGGQGNDVIAGGTGNDVIDGGEGNDTILGESGDDTIRGGGGDDVLDGGAGSDTLIGNLDSDVLTYKAGENGGAHDVYDGRKGNDTLRLVLTETEAANAAADLQAFQDFLAANADPDSNSGATFQFNAFDLQVRNVEALDLVVEPDPPPTGYTRVSTDSNGHEGNHDPFGYHFKSLAASDDGRFVAFVTEVAHSPDDTDTGDFIGSTDLYIKDTLTGAMTRIDTDYQVSEGKVHISADGRYVTYRSQYDGLVQTDLQTNTTARVEIDTSGNPVSVGSFHLSASSDGRHVAFTSYGTDFVTGDTNGVVDIYVRDMVGGGMQRATTDASGVEANGESYESAISNDGRYVAFASSADNLVAGDTNGAVDIFVKDLQTGAIVRASTDDLGSQGDRGSYDVSISGDGRYVSFTSGTNFGGDPDWNPGISSVIFRKDLQTGDLARVDADANGNPSGDSFNLESRISADGRFVLFFSGDDFLTPNDGNGHGDLFIKDMDTGAVEIVSAAPDGSVGNDGHPGFTAALSTDGSQIVFWSAATDLVPNDTNGIADVFMVANPFG